MLQNNLRKRVAASIYRESPSSTDINVSYYDYDLSGNVKTLYQQIAGLGVKTIGYEYDLASGKVNFVGYQHGQNDQFYYGYKYDDENRLTEAWSATQANVVAYGIGSKLDFATKKQDAGYSYYLHGPLARMELGNADSKVQGVDYAYTLQGWLKGVNGNALLLGTEQGADGANGIARDAMAYSLGYYADDYSPIGGGTAYGMQWQAGGDTGNPLYNGNISSSTVAIKGIGSDNPAGYTYGYDQLNRLTKMRQHGLSGSTTTWNSGSINGNYKEDYSYDGNGNILSLQRYGPSGQVMDKLGYVYNRDAVTGKLLNNRLAQLRDTITGVVNPGELDGVSDYTYDAIGNLTADSKEGISAIDWSVYGNIKSIAKSSGTVSYSYDPSGNRVSKTAGGLSTWYVRDAQGNSLGVYDNASSTINWREQQLYGSSRLGMWKPNINLASTTGSSVWSNTGQKFFELSNHLCNVLSVVSDSRSFVGSYHEPDVLSGQDYYPFGMIQPGRSFSSGSYRYGFNGKENDNELKGDGNQQDYGMRIYDPRVGKFLSTDPLSKEYPWYTPYSYAGNMPIRFIDIDGMEQGPPRLYFEPMKYSGKNTVADYAKTLPNAATGIVNGVVSLLYMAGDGINGAVRVFETGELPFNYKDVKQSFHSLGSNISANAKEVTKSENWSMNELGNALKSPETYQGTFELGAQLYLMSRPVLKTKAPSVGEGVLEIEKNGSTAANRMGQLSHKAYKSDLADNITTFKEYVIPNSLKRIDYIDFNTKTIYELKPNNTRAIREGKKQLAEYKSLIEKEFGEGWKTVLDKY